MTDNQLVHIDLNADLGESFGAWTMGDDLALLDIVTSANIACGFHDGDPLTMTRTVAAALDRGVTVGAHVSYRDLAGFGRRFVDAGEEELRADILVQLAALDGVCRAAGGKVSYLKPHGALYHAAGHYEPHARSIIAATAAYDCSITLLGMPGSLLLALAAEAGLATATEAFADRGYRADGSLVPRGEPGAVLHDPVDIAERVVGIARGGAVPSVEGTAVAVRADSVCVHGDTPGAVAIARAVRAGLEQAGVIIRGFGR
jgi:UPF0271 protein